MLKKKCLPMLHKYEVERIDHSMCRMGGSFCDALRDFQAVSTVHLVCSKCGKKSKKTYRAMAITC